MNENRKGIVSNFRNKKTYIVHIRNLNQALFEIKKLYWDKVIERLNKVLNNVIGLSLIAY